MSPQRRSPLLLAASFRGSLCFAFEPKKYGAPYLSVRKRTSKYSLSCSRNLAELLGLRKTCPVWFFRLIWREHLTLLIGKKSVALALIRHFGSLQALARASFQKLRQFLPRRQAESVVAAVSMSAIAQAEYARSEQLNISESIYRAWADMKLFKKILMRPRLRSWLS